MDLHCFSLSVFWKMADTNHTPGLGIISAVEGLVYAQCTGIKNGKDEITGLEGSTLCSTSPELSYSPVKHQQSVRITNILKDLRIRIKWSQDKPNRTKWAKGPCRSRRLPCLPLNSTERRITCEGHPCGSRVHSKHLRICVNPARHGMIVSLIKFLSFFSNHTETSKMSAPLSNAKEDIYYWSQLRKKL